MSALALILGRSGSKGVPGKNTAMLGGRQCVSWTMDHARSSRRVTRVALSTDDASMQQLGVERGIDVVARPAALADDDSRVDDAARHAIETLCWDRDPVVILYANVPIRPPGLIDAALDVLERTGCDSVQSFTPVGKHHPYWVSTIESGSGRVRPWDGSTINHGVHRRQDLPSAYVPDGGVLACTLDALLLRLPGVPSGPHAFLGRDCRGITTQEGEVLDIDSPIDLLVADTMLRADHIAGSTPAPL